jgi:hypothetical protein
MAPVVEMSQSLESMATVAELLPRVVTPVEERVVKEPARGVDCPMVPVKALEVEERVETEAVVPCCPAA